VNAPGGTGKRAGAPGVTQTRRVHAPPTQTERSTTVSDTPTEAEAPQIPTEDWVYLGESFDLAGAHAWRDDSGRRLLFKAAKARVPGGIYTVRVKRDADGGVTLYGRDFTYTGRQAEDAAAIQVQAQATEVRIKAKRLAANTSRTGAIDEAVTDLLRMAAGLKTYGDRRALADYVVAKIHAAH
jgi:hypothetical protein